MNNEDLGRAMSKSKEHVGTAASPALSEAGGAVQPSKAKRPDLSSLQKNAHFSHFAHKTELCFKTGTAGTRMPRRQVTTIGLKPTPRRGVSQWRRQPCGGSISILLFLATFAEVLGDLRGERLLPASNTGNRLTSRDLLP
jgi:hypothetical protein